jgi:hypothetical protein
MVITLLLSLCIGEAHAAPAAAGQTSTSFKQLVQGGPPVDFGDGLFAMRCPTDQFYACWVEPYGRRVCGCWQGGDRPACPSGYHYACRVAPDGRGTCACY